jgi:putative transposase
MMPIWCYYGIIADKEVSMVVRRQTFRLYPSKSEEKALFGARRLHCYLYNACVSHRQTVFRTARLNIV